LINKKFEIVSEWMEKYVRLQEKVDELVEENLKLESSVNLMSIDMAESGYASQGTWQKLQETTTTRTSIQLQ
jgi:hypothetical protein